MDLRSGNDHRSLMGHGYQRAPDIQRDLDFFIDLRTKMEDVDGTQKNLGVRITEKAGKRTKWPQEGYVIRNLLCPH